MNSSFARTVLALAATAALASCTTPAPPDESTPPEAAWGRQFGTSSTDFVWDIAIDADGNTYVTGATLGGLEGTSAGGNDAYVRSYDADGDLRWTRQYGSPEDDYASAIASDGHGNIYVAGSTYGALDGANAGNTDAYLRSLDADGNHRWTHQFVLAGADGAYGVATDAGGNVYATGAIGGIGDNAGSSDGFVVSYDSDGNHRWSDFFGSTGLDVGLDVTVDLEGNTYVAGHTQGDLEGANVGGDDAFVRMYDATGTHVWTRQFGTGSDDFGYGIAVDADGNSFVAGYTTGDLEGVAAGLGDAFVRSYDRDGTLRWTRQYGTTSADGAFDIAIDAEGNTYGTGFTQGALDGANAGGNDVFVRSYDPNGSLRWTRQFGTGASDRGLAIALDTDGRAYSAGNTYGALEGAHAGSADGFVRLVVPND
jgi:hypothetical protein